MADNAGPSNSGADSAQALNQFREFCDVDTNVARDFLEKSAWNLEEAVHQYFLRSEAESSNNDNNNDNAQNERRSAAVASASNNTSRPSLNMLRRNNSNNQNGGVYDWMRWLQHYLVTVPLQLFYSAVTQAFTFIYVLLGNHTLPITDPRADIHNFLEDIVGKHEGHDRITFVNGPYDEALRRAKRNVQCLIVYLHSPSVQCDDFLRSVLLTDRFCGLLQRNDALLWGASARTGEGRRVAHSLRLINYPAMALITCVPGGNMACILRLSGNELSSENGVYTALQASFDENLPHLMPLLNEKAARELNSQLIREQEMEYARSLATDRAKRDEKLRLEAEQKERERQEQEELNRMEEKKRRLMAIREEIRAKLPAQPELLDNSAGSSGVVCVRMKFPGGQTHTWNFDCAASLEELFNVVFAQECCPDDFSLIMGYPPQTLHCTPDWYREFSSVAIETITIPTFEASGFHKSAVVLVRDNDA